MADFDLYSSVVIKHNCEQNSFLRFCESFQGMVESESVSGTPKLREALLSFIELLSFQRLSQMCVQFSQMTNIHTHAGYTGHPIAGIIIQPCWGSAFIRGGRGLRETSLALPTFLRALVPAHWKSFSEIHAVLCGHCYFLVFTPLQLPGYLAWLRGALELARAGSCGVTRDECIYTQGSLQRLQIGLSLPYPQGSCPTLTCKSQSPTTHFHLLLWP